MVLTGLDLFTQKVVEFLFLSPTKSFPSILRKIPIGVTKKKKIRAITTGATNLPKSMPNLNQRILARKKVLGLIMDKNKNPKESSRKIHCIMEVGNDRKKYAETIKDTAANVRPKDCSEPLVILKCSSFSFIHDPKVELTCCSTNLELMVYQQLFMLCNRLYQFSFIESIAFLSKFVTLRLRNLERKK